MPKLNEKEDLKKLLLILKSNLSTEDRSLIITALLESVNALPIKDIFTYDLDGTINVNGKKLTPEQAILLKDGATALSNNWAYNLIKEQITWEAIKMGVHSSTTIDMLMFSKAAIWTIQQISKLVSDLNPDLTEKL